MKRPLLLALGFISFGLGSIGAILPVLPTTPFLLLAGYCFGCSSERFSHWLEGTKLYQFYAADFVDSRAIPKKKKKLIYLNILVLMGISIYFAPLNWVRFILIGLTIFLTIMLFFVIPVKK